MSKADYNRIKFNIVTEPKEKTWVLGRIAGNIAGSLGASITYMKPDLKADVNIYVNYKVFRAEFKHRLDIGWFTHKEDSEFDHIATQLDWCIAQSDNTLKLLPSSKSSYVPIGIDDQFVCRDDLIIGIVGRKYKNGRKRFDMISDLNIAGIKFCFTDGKLDYKDLPEFYKSCDYILVTSSNEGGPMCVMEAIGLHKPLIVPVNVGWCDEFPALRYKSKADLKSILLGLVYNRLSWDRLADHILNISRNIYEN